MYHLQRRDEAMARSLEQRVAIDGIDAAGFDCGHVRPPLVSAEVIDGVSRLSVPEPTRGNDEDLGVVSSDHVPRDRFGRAIRLEAGVPTRSGDHLTDTGRAEAHPFQGWV